MTGNTRKAVQRAQAHHGVRVSTKKGELPPPRHVYRKPTAREIDAAREAIARAASKIAALWKRNRDPSPG